MRVSDTPGWGSGHQKVKMSKPSNTARAIQIDKQVYELEAEVTRIAGTASNPNTCAETHVAKIAERVQARAEFLKSVASWFGRKSMDE